MPALVEPPDPWSAKLEQRRSEAARFAEMQRQTALRLQEQERARLEAGDPITAMGVDAWRQRELTEILEACRS